MARAWIGWGGDSRKPASPAGEPPVRLRHAGTSFACCRVCRDGLDERDRCDGRSHDEIAQMTDAELVVADLCPLTFDEEVDRRRRASRYTTAPTSAPRPSWLERLTTRKRAPA
jgi:hypothetical protein